MTDLTGKVALITGASRGLGRAIAERYASLGAAVVVNYRQDAASAQAVVDDIEGKGGVACAVQGDVSRVVDIETLFQRTLDRHSAIDIVVANAGVEVIDQPFDAVNLFYRDLPRLSVDIDLTYLPIKDRRESLAEINEAMDRMAAAIEGGIPGAKTQRIQGGGGGATRVLARLGGAEIKIETSPVMRGVVHDPEMRPVSDAVEDDHHGGCIGMGEDADGVPARGAPEQGDVLPMEFRLHLASGELLFEGRCGDIDAEWWHGFEPLHYTWTPFRCRRLSYRRAGTAEPWRWLRP